jgi:LuxR family transcriptional regulator, maltose regulon positive regulatory protein
MSHIRLNSRTPARRAFTHALALTRKREIFRPFARRRQLVAAVHETFRPKELALTNIDEIRTFNQILARLGLTESASMPSDEQETTVAPLTLREIELLRYLEAGFDNSQIAERIDVTTRTIKWHLSNL